MSKSNNVLIAAITGFVAGILLAPKSGAETREDIKKKSLEAKAQLDEKASGTMEVLRDGANRTESEVRGMVESVKQSARTVAGETGSLEKEAKARANRVAEEAKRSARKE